MPNIQLKSSIVFQSYKEAVSALIIITDGMQDESIVSVGRDGFLKIYSLQSGQLTRSVALSSVPLCSCVSYKSSSNSNILVVGSWDNSLYILIQIQFVFFFQLFVRFF